MKINPGALFRDTFVTGGDGIGREGWGVKIRAPLCVFLGFFCNFVFCNCVLMGMGLGGRGRG